MLLKPEKTHIHKKTKNALQLRSFHINIIDSLSEESIESKHLISGALSSFIFAIAFPGPSEKHQYHVVKLV